MPSTGTLCMWDLQSSAPLHSPTNPGRTRTSPSLHNPTHKGVMRGRGTGWGKATMPHGRWQAHQQKRSHEASPASCSIPASAPNHHGKLEKPELPSPPDPCQGCFSMSWRKKLSLSTMMVTLFVYRNIFPHLLWFRFLKGWDFQGWDLSSDIYRYPVPSTARALCWQKSLYPTKSGKTVTKIMPVLPLYMGLCWKNKQVLGQEKNFFFLWSGVSQQNSPLQRAPGLLLNLKKQGWMVLIRRCLWLVQLYGDKRKNWEGLKLL